MLSLVENEAYAECVSRHAHVGRVVADLGHRSRHRRLVKEQQRRRLAPAGKQPVQHSRYFIESDSGHEENHTSQTVVGA